MNSPNAQPTRMQIVRSRSFILMKERLIPPIQKMRSAWQAWSGRPWWFQQTDPVAKFTGWVAIYTAVLCGVSGLQFLALLSTDRTTHQALVAANRAWVGPAIGTITSIEKDRGIEVTIQYNNTGREPAFDFFDTFDYEIFPMLEWNSGAAAEKLSDWSSRCLKVDKISRGARVAYPTSGATFYSLIYNTDNAANKRRWKATEGIVEGREAFAVQGCFLYRSIDAIRHTSFCLFYQANVTKLPALNLCTVGNEAD